jgi:hypothetical protein
MCNQNELTNSEAIQLYEVLVNRNKHEGILFWTRFSAFFLFFTAFLAAWAKGSIVVSDKLSDGFNFLSDPTARVIILIAGSLTTLSWFLVNLNGAFWQEYFNHQINSLEEKYKVLSKTYSNHWKAKFFQIDVVIIAIIISALTLIAWIVMSFFYSIVCGFLSMVSCAVFVLLGKFSTKLWINVTKDIGKVGVES